MAAARPPRDCLQGSALLRGLRGAARWCRGWGVWSSLARPARAAADDLRRSPLDTVAGAAAAAVLTNVALLAARGHPLEQPGWVGRAAILGLATVLWGCRQPWRAVREGSRVWCAAREVVRWLRAGPGRRAGPREGPVVTREGTWR